LAVRGHEGRQGAALLRAPQALRRELPRHSRARVLRRASRQVARARDAEVPGDPDHELRRRARARVRRGERAVRRRLVHRRRGTAGKVLASASRRQRADGDRTSQLLRRARGRRADGDPQDPRSGRPPERGSGQLRDHRGPLHRLPDQDRHRPADPGGAPGQAHAQPFPLPRLQHAGLEPPRDPAPDLGSTSARLEILGDPEGSERDRAAALESARSRRSRRPTRGVHHRSRRRLPGFARGWSRHMTQVVETPPEAGQAVPETPYVGLTPFTERDAQFFFGREKERRLIAANLLASRLTLLYGASGVGKSSVIRAGVQRDSRVQAEEALASGRYPQSLRVSFTGCRDDVTAGLADCLTSSIREILGELAPEPPPDNLPIDELLLEWTRRLDDRALEVFGPSEIGAPIRTELLVVFDQFEQYFVYHPDEDGPGTFAVEFPRAVN